MSFKKILFFSLIFIFLSYAVFARPLKLRKGPYLFFSGGQLILQVQEKSLKKPFVKLKKEQTGEVHQVDFEKKGSGIWQVKLGVIQNKKSFRYQIYDKERFTDWYEIKRDANFKFSIYGDNRTGWGDSAVHKQILKKIAEENPAFILHTGDMVAYGNQLNQWDLFFQTAPDVLAQTPFLPTIGNHDISAANWYYRFFPVSQDKEMFYAFEYGQAHFICLDTTQPVHHSTKQYRFLEKTLKKWQGKSPIIVYMHHPPFSAGKHGSERKVREQLVPLFEKYGVDLVMSGHDHSYQRIGPINGVTYIVTGGGGAPLVNTKPNAEIQNFKTLHHFITFRVRRDQIIGEVKNERGVVEDFFQILHRNNPIPHEKLQDWPELEKYPRKTL